MKKYILPFIVLIYFGCFTQVFGQQKFLLGTDRYVTAENGTLLDNGGENGNIGNNYLLSTFSSPNSTEEIELYFSEIDIPAGAKLNIYNGADVNAADLVISFESTFKTHHIFLSTITIEYVPAENTTNAKGWTGFLRLREKTNGKISATKPESDCPGAINICSNTTVNTSANQYEDTGVINDDAGSCYSGTGSGGSVWYTFVPQTNGLLDFSIAPLGSTDYDYVLWDITAGCASKTEISCNFSGTNGTTGLNSSGATNSEGSSGPVWNQRETVSTTKRYAICINYYGGTNGGFNLTFKNEATSVNVLDLTPPSIVNVSTTQCPSASTLNVIFSEYIDCSTIQNSDFTIAGRTVTVSTSNCSGNTPTAAGQTLGVTLSISPALTSGTYTLNTVNMNDICGNVMPSINTTVTIGTNPTPTISTVATVCRTTSFFFGIPTGYNYTPASQTLTAGGGSTYYWPSTGSTSASQTFSPSSTTTYTVNVMNGSCAVPTSRTIVVEPTPTPNLGADQTICGSQVTLSSAAIAGATYSFYSSPVSATNHGTLLSTGTTNSFLATGIAAATTFRVVVTSANGCAGRDDMVVSLGGAAAANAGTAQTICGGGSVTLNGTTSAASYNWSSNASLSCTNCLNPVATPTTTTTYTLNASCPDGSTSISNVTITVQPYGTLNSITETTCDPSNITFNTAPNSAGATGYTYNWYSANSVTNPCPTSVAGMNLEFTETRNLFSNQSIFAENFDGLATTTNLATPVGGWSQTTVTSSVNTWGIGTVGLIGAIAGKCLEVHNGATANAYNPTDDANQIARFGPISTANTSSMVLTFNWVGEGEMDETGSIFGCGTSADAADRGHVMYSLDGTTWTNLGGPYFNRATVQTATINLPAACNNTNIYIGFRWENDANAASDATGGFSNTACTGKYNRNPFKVDNININGNVLQTYTSALNPAAGITTDKTYIVQVTPVGGTCNGVAYVASNCSQVTMCGVLPLEDLDFKGKCSAKNIHFNWNTNNEEQHNYKFTLEGSSNLKNWNTISSNTNSNSVSISNSSANDYYRLKAVENNGEISYSNAIQVDCNTTSENVNIYPNPTQNELNVVFSSIDAELITIQVMDILGREITDYDKSEIDFNNSIKLNTSRLSNGIYFIKISEGTQEINKFKFVKN
jgi:hypothetical protein